MSRLRPMWTALAAFAAAWVAICAIAWLLQDRMILFPGGPPRYTPKTFGWDYEDVELIAADGVRLHAWWIPAQSPAGGATSRGAVFVCHGNAGNVENRLDLAGVALEMGLSVLLFDYRGYGKSAGRPSERGLRLDAQAAYEHLVRERGIEPARVVAWGESLGAALATELASREPLGALVLESAFTSLADIAAHHYRFLPVRLLLRWRLDTGAALASVTAPVLVVHSASDEIVPFSHGRALFELARGPKQLIESRGGHNDRGWAGSNEDRQKVRAFFDAHLP